MWRYQQHAFTDISPLPQLRSVKYCLIEGVVQRIERRRAEMQQKCSDRSGRYAASESQVNHEWPFPLAKILNVAPDDPGVYATARRNQSAAPPLDLGLLPVQCLLVQPCLPHSIEATFITRPLKHSLRVCICAEPLAVEMPDTLGSMPPRQAKAALVCLHMPTTHGEAASPMLRFDTNRAR